MLAGSSIADEGRTLHMGIDIFSRDLETVYAPCDGEIIRTAYEAQDHGYGNYLILKPEGLGGIYFFLGHLSKELPALGAVKAGEPIAVLGDYADDENGGWSRHLHLQMTTELPPEGKTPDGYSAKVDFPKNSQRFPNPMQYFPEWGL
jgi:murein DD-endopeptidase MepM/ murein hydrolase activator NlpD